MNAVSQGAGDHGGKSVALALALFATRMNAICEEMGATLRCAAFSPNIRDRLDYSCALFDAQGHLCAQAAHIPVHLGSMAHAMTTVVHELDWSQGDMVVFNDPYRGGTHLPDVTLVAPVFVDGKLVAFAANRAHHADIGAESAGSMPVSRSLQEEGVVIPPCYWLKGGQPEMAVIEPILSRMKLRSVSEGDFSAQIAANRAGVGRLQALVVQLGLEGFAMQLEALNDYGRTLATQALAKIPDGEYCFRDVMDDDGQPDLGGQDLEIAVQVTAQGGRIRVGFDGTAPQVQGNINCPLSVTAAAVHYVLRCLMPPQTPACAGVFDCVEIDAPPGCLVNARFPAAVAAGNVETSSRIVDALLGALAIAMPNRIPAASQGTMNNVAMGSAASAAATAQHWDYYETIGGGMGAGPLADGLSGVQTHMTNTLNTPVEVLESCYPLRIEGYRLRHGSGGEGRQQGGDGVIRSFRFLADAEVSLLTERRRLAPWGLQGGAPGLAGENCLNGERLPAKINRQVSAGDLLRIATPGGGGWGAKTQN